MKHIFETPVFYRVAVPKWPCPSCEHGKLIAQEDKFFHKMDSDSKNEIDEDWFEPTEIEYVFTCIQECDFCRESVVMTGIGGVGRYLDENSPEKYYDYFRPTFFQPALQIIEFPANPTLPRAVRKSLEKSFPMFWCDYDACANRIRGTLELLLDAMGIPRKMDVNATREMSLHHRIEKINAQEGSEEDEVKQMIMALKWLGNAGSHELEGIEWKQLIQGYKMIELCLHRLYPKVDHEGAKLIALAKEINASKKFKLGL